MHRDIPSAIRPFERGDHGLAFKKNFSQDIDHTFGCVLVADCKADAVRRGDGSH